MYVLLCCSMCDDMALLLQHCAHLTTVTLQVGMVIDLTNSRRYYDFDDATGRSEFQYAEGPEVFHRKVLLACKSTNLYRKCTVLSLPMLIHDAHKDINETESYGVQLQHQC